MARSHVITLGVAIANSPTDETWVFLDWSVPDRLQQGETAWIAGGPNGDEPIIVDNGLYTNGNKHPNGFSGTLSDPRAHLGEAATTCYTAVPAIDITAGARADGVWHVQLLDWGYTYTASPLYLVIK